MKFCTWDECDLAWSITRFGAYLRAIQRAGMQETA